MRALLLFLISIFYLQQCEAQKVVVANLKENIAYIGIPNPLGILAEGYKWDQIEVSTDNGMIERQDDGRIYVFQPDKAGKALITLKAKTGKKKAIGTMEFRVKFLPNPVPDIGGQNGGMLAKNRLVVWPGLIARLKGFDLEVKFNIQAFSFAVFRQDSSLFNKSNIEGPLFSEELKQHFRQTKEGDKLIFYGITAHGPDKRLLELSPMEFTITE